MAKAKQNVGTYLVLQKPLPLTQPLSAVYYRAYRFELLPEYKVLRGKSGPLTPSEAFALLLPEAEKNEKNKSTTKSLRGHIRTVSSSLFRRRKSKTSDDEDVPSTAPSPKSFPFLRLPPELRLLIYTHLSAFTLLNLSHTSRTLRHELTASSFSVQHSNGFRLTLHLRKPTNSLTIHNIAGVTSAAEARLLSRLYKLYPRVRADLDGPRMLHARHEECVVCGRKKVEYSVWEDFHQCHVWRRRCGCVELKEWLTRRQVGDVLRMGRDLRFMVYEDIVWVGDKPISDKWFRGQPVVRAYTGE